MSDELMHYGTPRHSGRYPWGSGDNPYQHELNFRNHYKDLKKQGLSDVDIAKGMGMSTTELRAKLSIAKDRIKMEEMREARRLKEKGMSTSAIGRQMGKNESSIRLLLDEDMAEKRSQAGIIADELKKHISKTKYLDIGPGAELSLGVSSTKLKTIVAMLKEEGYTTQNIPVQQLGTGSNTTVKVLAPPGTEWKTIVNNKDRIHSLDERIIDEADGLTRLGIMNSNGISSDRILVRYAEEGGVGKDGVIELKRNVDDISLGKASYAQVRIAVDGTHYLKGMAVYSDDKEFPSGVDVIFNTNKHVGTAKEDVFKKLSSDKDNPFGATIKDEKDLKVTQRYYVDKDGNKQLSAINIVNEEGDWNTWAKRLSSQFLSKQNVPLAKKQLDISYKEKKEELDEISQLTNPEVKKKLLASFADDCDSSAVHLKAAALPRQASKVILPVPSLKNDEIYAPTFNDGEEVVLVRYPHGGIFEIPRLKVNNRNRNAKSVLGNAPDAVGINASVAERLSGVDFDGDTVLVIPTKTAKIRTADRLEKLIGFDPKEYKLPDSAPEMKDSTKQKKMGEVSNLITDMTLQGATPDELARAVKHSMVVIDAVKHHLDYKASYVDNNIAELEKKYQPKADSSKKAGGAYTIISKAKSEARPRERKSYTLSKSTVDPETGEKIYTETGSYYVDAKGRKQYRTQKSTKMAEAKDAYDLVSPARAPMELVYADYANKMKALGNEARKEWIATPSMERSPSAAKTYAREVESLDRSLTIALKNAPRERKAQIMANVTVDMKVKANPDLDDDHLKKIKSQALATERARYGAKKTPIEISPKEWEAIQAGAISKTKLQKILNNTDLDVIKQYATPRSSYGVSNAQISKIKALSNSGYTLKEIADRVGVSTSTVSGVLVG